MTDIIQYPEHRSETGSFQELARASNVEFGQLSILTVSPRCQRGGHYHRRKKEWFCCIRGRCFIVSANTRGEQTDGVLMDGWDRKFVLIEPHTIHTVLNPRREECELLIISSEEYNPEDADTYWPSK